MERAHPHHQVPAKARGEDVNEESEQPTAYVNIKAYEPPVQDEQRADAQDDRDYGHRDMGSRAKEGHLRSLADGGGWTFLTWAGCLEDGDRRITAR